MSKGHSTRDRIGVHIHGLYTTHGFQKPLMQKQLRNQPGIPTRSPVFRTIPELRAFGSSGPPLQLGRGLYAAGARRMGFGTRNRHLRYWEACIGQVRCQYHFEVRADMKSDGLQVKLRYLIPKLC